MPEFVVVVVPLEHTSYIFGFYKLFFFFLLLLSRANVCLLVACPRVGTDESGTPWWCELFDFLGLFGQCHVGLEDLVFFGNELFLFFAQQFPVFEHFRRRWSLPMIRVHHLFNHEFQGKRCVVGQDVQDTRS